jgi:hypothetical protein
MAEAVKPTNEQIVKLLDQILSDLSEMKNGQQELAADLGKLAQTIK